MFVIKKDQNNPILKPTNNHWESYATFNWSPTKIGEKTYACYRAMSDPDILKGPRISISSIGRAESDDGIHFKNRDQLIVPEEEWEKYGCEDPRITRIEDRNYIFYTALSGYPFAFDNIKTAAAIVNDDFTKVEKRGLVTPFNSKAMTLFPEKINGKYHALITVHPDQPPSSICIVSFDSLDQIWDTDFWRSWYASYRNHELNIPKKSSDHIEIGAAPIKTDKGWLIVYSHIQNYYEESKRLFGVEAILLDHNDLNNVIGETPYPFLTPTETYEKHGQVENIVFPSGALVDGDRLKIFYGGADQVCCLAETSLKYFVDSIHTESRKNFVVRSSEEPVLKPKEENDWEAFAVFNPTAIDLGGKIHVLYRAMSKDNTSYVGYFNTKDGINIDEKLEEPIYSPRIDYESKKVPNGNSGCEDARVTYLDGRIYMTYTAYNGIDVPRVGITSISEEDFLNKNWNWTEPSLITPTGVDDKDTCIMPKKFGDEYMIIHRMQHHICADMIPSLEFTDGVVDQCMPMLDPRPGMWDDLKVGLAGTPMETEKGWLMLYHGVSSDKKYRVGAALLDKDQPLTVISRTTDFIFEPEKEWELKGIVDNVVFPCGHVIRDNTIFMYYGGADEVLGIATMKLDEVLDALE